VEASVSNDGAAIRKASRAASSARERIETLYDELGALGNELHQKERAFGSETTE
jgi:hypothetical protein